MLTFVIGVRRYFRLGGRGQKLQTCIMMFETTIAIIAITIVKLRILFLELFKCPSYVSYTAVNLGNEADEGADLGFDKL